MSDDSRFDPRFDPAFQRGWDGPVPQVLPEPARQTEPERVVVSALPEPEEVDDAERRLNPFLIVIGAVAVALVVAGLWMASQVSAGFNATDATTPIDYPTLQILLIGAPIATLLGVATAIGVLFVFAVRWGQRS